jgi:predicted permease
MLASLWQDIRYALRTLRQQPLFATVAVASLALGIGLNAAVFTTVDALLLRPLPVQDPDRLAAVFTSHEHGEVFGTTSYPDFVDLAAESSATFSALAGRSMMFAPVSLPSATAGPSGAGGSNNRLVMGEVVTANYFTAIGVPPALGRAFTPEEDRGEGAHAVAVLSDRLWRQSFNASPDAIGRTFTLAGRPYTVVGVAPRTFEGLTPGLRMDLWIPISMVEDVEPVGMNAVVASPGRTRLERRGSRWMSVVGRLAPGATPASAEAHLNAVMSRLGAAFPGSNADRRMRVTPAASIRVHPSVDGAIRPAGLVLLAAVALVLLVACANLASMLLARGIARGREIAVRSALGAGRGRLVRQLAVESLVLAAVAGAAGLLLARWTTGALMSVPMPVDLPVAFALTMDWRVVLFTAALSIVTGLAAGLLPALRASTADLVPALKADAPLSTPGRRLTAGRGLVVVQVAVSLVLVVAGLLLVRSLAASRRVDPGFDVGRVSVASLSLDFQGYDEARGRAFYEQAVSRVERVPGVERVALADRLPFSPNAHTTSLVVDGRPDATPRDGLVTDTAWVSASYFDVMGLRILDGRGFDTRDTPDAPLVGVVNETLARRLWPGESAIGKRVRMGSQTGATVDVVGVMPDFKIRTVGEAPRPIIHFAASQRYSPYLSVIVRGSGDLAPIARQVEAELRAIEPGLVLMQSGPLSTLLDLSLFPVRAGAALIGGLAALAMLLSGLGLYGVIAFGVSRRTREIGIRMALGAGRGRIVGQVAREAIVLVGAGAVVGLGIAALSTQALRGVLLGVAPLDPVSFLAAVAVLAAAAALAAAVPARRAASIDPLRALRQG